MESIRLGLTGEAHLVVSEPDSAKHWGSGTVPVFGTPSLVALMENAAVNALDGHLSSEETSVGARMDLRHLAPTPVGMRVRAQAKLREVSGRRLVFHIEAWDDVERIGEASHERFVVETRSFVAQAEAKNR